MTPWMAVPEIAPPEDPTRPAYFDAGRAHSCSREDLMLAIRDDARRRICWIWDPASPGWENAAEVPWLSADLRARIVNFLHGERYTAGTISVFCLFLVGLYVVGVEDDFAEIVFFAMLGVVPWLQYSWDLYRTRSDVARAIAESAQEACYDAWIARQPSRWTWALLAGIAVVGAVQLAVAVSAGGQAAILAPGVVKSAIRDGEWWRLLTGTLLHGSLLHFGLNALALLGLGRIVEGTFGGPCVPLVFVLAALTGSISSLVLLPDGTSVGASGGILGLLGFLLAATWRRTPLPAQRRLVQSVLYCAIAGVIGFQFIDNAGHLGGLLGGGVLGFALAKQGAVRVGGEVAPSVRLAGAAASAVTLAGIVVAIVAMVAAAIPSNG